MPRPPRAAAPLRSKGPLPESCLENSSGGTSNRGAEAPLIGRFKVGVGGREIEIPPPPFLSHRFLSERKRCRRRPGLLWAGGCYPPLQGMALRMGCGSGLLRCSRRLRASCHAAGWAHGRVAKSGLREKCRSGLRPSPVFSSAPCLSSPMRLPSALLRCHAPPVRDARLPSDSGHKRPVCELAWFVPVAPVHPGCSRRLRASFYFTRVFPTRSTMADTLCMRASNFWGVRDCWPSHLAWAGSL